jgi:hypothetical protein
VESMLRAFKKLEKDPDIYVPSSAGQILDMDSWRNPNLMSRKMSASILGRFYFLSGQGFYSILIT